MTSTGLGGGRTLWEALAEIPDRRGRKGRHYALRAVLSLAPATMLTGANDLMAIFQWARRLPPEALRPFGLDRAPCHATYHYFFKISSRRWTSGRWSGFLGRGRAAMGRSGTSPSMTSAGAAARHDGSNGVHLVAAFASRLGVVIGQLQVPPEANEITAALALLKSLPLEGAIVTGDAEFCQRAICQAVRGRGGDYLFTIKANQPQLTADIAVAFGDAFPPGADRRLARSGADWSGAVGGAAPRS